MTSTSQRRLSVYSTLVVLTVTILLPACTCTQKGSDFTPQSTEIVKITTVSMAEVTFSTSENSTLEQFLRLETVEGADDRRDIRDAWRAIPLLSDKLPDFPDKAWQESEQDGDWPQGTTVPELVYVAGFRQGIRSYLEGAQ